MKELQTRRKQDHELAVLRRLVDKLTKGDSKLCEDCIAKNEVAQVSKLLKPSNDEGQDTSMNLEFEDLSEIALEEILNDFDAHEGTDNS